MPITKERINDLLTAAELIEEAYLTDCETIKSAASDLAIGAISLAEAFNIASSLSHSATQRIATHSTLLRLERMHYRFTHKRAAYEKRKQQERRAIRSGDFKHAPAQTTAGHSLVNSILPLKSPIPQAAAPALAMNSFLHQHAASQRNTPTRQIDRPEDLPPLSPELKAEMDAWLKSLDSLSTAPPPARTPTAGVTSDTIYDAETLREINGQFDDDGAIPQDWHPDVTAEDEGEGK